MLEVEQWIIRNNPDFFIKEIEKKEDSPLNLGQAIENVKQAELELLNILESQQIETEDQEL